MNTHANDNNGTFLVMNNKQLNNKITYTGSLLNISVIKYFNRLYDYEQSLFQDIFSLFYYHHMNQSYW